MKMFEVARIWNVDFNYKKRLMENFILGDEDLQQLLIQKMGVYVAIIVDKDGFTKAQSKALKKKKR